MIYIGIRRENKSVWERRAPISPSDAKIVMENNSDLKFIVQPSGLRIFSDE